MRDLAKEEPERFARAVHAACDIGNDDCTYPDCGCSVFPLEVQAAIMGWYESAVDGQTKD